MIHALKNVLKKLFGLLKNVSVTDLESYNKLIAFESQAFNNKIIDTLLPILAVP